MPIILPTTPLLRIQLNQRINPHNGDTRLDRALQLLHLAHARLQDTGLETIMDFTVGQVEAVVLVPFAAGEAFCVVGGGGVGGGALGEGVAGAELGDEVGGVFCGVCGEGFGDREERGGEGGDGELFAGALGEGGVSVDVWGGLEIYVPPTLPTLPSRCAGPSRRHRHPARCVRSRVSA